MTKPTKPPREWSMALCPSGKILEIKEGLVPECEMLPPCSSDDLPQWVRVSEHSTYIALLQKYEKLVNLIKKPYICVYCKEREPEKWGKSCKGQENSCCSFRIELKIGELDE